MENVKEGYVGSRDSFKSNEEKSKVQIGSRKVGTKSILESAS